MHLSDLIDHQEHTAEPPSLEQPLVVDKPKADTSNLRAQESSPRLDRLSLSNDAHSKGLPPPGLAPPPAFVSPLFYETVRNTQPPKSCQTPSSTGATRGANSSAESKRRDDATPPLTPMSAPNDTSDGDPPPLPGHNDASTGSFRPVSGASHQRSLQRQPYPAQPYYPSHSAPPQEQAYVPPGPYGHQPVQGSSFMGQYMASQASLPMALQSPVQFGYSHSFAHPGIHAQDTSALGMPFSPPPHPPQHNLGYAYRPPPGPSSEVHAGDRGGRPGPGYAVVDAAGAPQPPGSAPPATGPHMPHHAYPQLHYSAASTAPHYPAYSPHSFAHSPSGLYPFAPPPATYTQSFYGQQPASPEDASKGGTWWYLPPGGTQQYDSSAYQPGYPIAGYQPSMRMGRHEFDPYGSQPQAGPSSPPPFAGPSGQHMRQPPGTALARERPFVPSSPVAARAPSSVPDGPRPDPSSPISKKRSPMSASPPPASRKSYHPNPPPNRSEWVMWVGNVPSDATHDELWRFFNQPAPHAPPPGTSAMMSSRQVRPVDSDEEGDLWGGVASVFLISRSNCAFVNFETEQHLGRAVVHFNGKPLRPKDPRCPRLVCRVRRKDDDLKAGVGGQRGMGLHTRWVADQKERGRDRELQAQQKGRSKRSGSEGESSGEGPPTSPSTYLAPSSSSDPSPPIPAVSPTDDPGTVPLSRPRESPGSRGLRHGSSGNQSFASTNSSFLASNFPKRYFILKSLTQYDLNLSLDRGIWATQPHNEEILDQAYRTSSDVFLIFGANKSGEFFGYARMAGPILHNDRVDHVSWASRSSGQGSAGGARGGSNPPEAIKEEDETDRSLFLSPGEHRLVDESPAPVTPGEKTRLKLKTSSKDGIFSKFDEEFATAPPELHHPHRPISHPVPPREAETLPEPPRKAVPSVEPRLKAVSDGPQFLLDPKKVRDPAGIQAHRDLTGKGPASAMDTDGVRRKDTLVTQEELRNHRGKDAVGKLTMPPRAEPGGQDENTQAQEKPEGWGRDFKIEWQRTERLPFHRTRHLRNPWNHDREVKVSRDGTELEPTVGQQLLDEWDKPAVEVDASPPTSPISRARGSRPPARAVGAPTGSMPSISAQAYRAGPPGGFAQGRGRGTPQP